MKKELLTLCLIFAGISLCSAELLTDRNWKFAKTWNAAGELKKQDNGSYVLENTGNAGSITMTCAEEEFTITPGKRYLVTVDLEHSAPTQKHSLFVALPGARRPRKPELRTPWENRKQAAIEFTARPDERRLAIYFSTSGTGKTTIKSVRVEEYTPVKNLLQRPGINWNFIAAPGATGKYTRLDNGNMLIEKTSGKAHVMSYLTLPMEIKEGKIYRVTISGKPSDKVSRWGVMSHTGSQRPWPSRNASGKPGEWQEAAVEVNAAAGDTGLRIYAVLHHQGSVEVRSITVEESFLRRELLQERLWTVSSLGGQKAVTAKQKDKSWKITKKDDKGQLVFTCHGHPFPIIPGHHYRINWQIIAPVGSKVNSMTYLPRKPKARSPWPGSKAITTDGKLQNVIQIISAEPDEKGMRPHLVISGKAGDIIVKNCTITEISAEDAAKFNNK